MDALEQHCKNAVGGHPRSGKILDGRWADHPSRGPKRARVRNSAVPEGQTPRAVPSTTVAAGPRSDSVGFVSHGELVSEASWRGGGL